jgi:hypothetical protein
MSGPLTNAATTMTSGSNNNKYLRLSGAVAVTAPAVGGQSRSSPPQFRRMPSRRHQRRIVDNGASHRKISLIVFFLFLVSFSAQLRASFIIHSKITRVLACVFSLIAIWWYLLCGTTCFILSCSCVHFGYLSEPFFFSSSSSTSVRIWERRKIKDYHKRSRWGKERWKQFELCMIISLEYIFKGKWKENARGQQRYNISFVSLLALPLSRSLAQSLIL